VQLPNARETRPNKHQLKSERTRAVILDAAEPLFAPHGLVGVSMRQIAAAADVDLSLVAYHFESKLALYNAVIDRVMVEFTERRTALLDELEARKPDHGVVDLFDVMLTAWFEIRFGDAPHRAPLIRRGYSHDPDGPALPEERPSDAFVKRFMGALARAEPERTVEYIHWAYHCLTGAMVYLMNSGERVQRLSGGYCDVTSPDAVREAMLQQVRNTFPPTPARARKPRAKAAA
jgi:AcrR family transcriptional regulator